MTFSKRFRTIALGLGSAFFYCLYIVAWADYTNALPDRDSIGQLYHPALAALKMLEEGFGFKQSCELIPMGSYPLGPQILAFISHSMALGSLVQGQFFHLLTLCIVPTTLLISLDNERNKNRILIILCFLLFPISIVSLKTCSLHSFNVFFGFCAILCLKQSMQQGKSILWSLFAVLFLGLSIALKHLGFVQFLALALATLLLAETKSFRSSLLTLFLALLLGTLSYSPQSYATYLYDTLTHNNEITPVFYPLLAGCALFLLTIVPYWRQKTPSEDKECLLNPGLICFTILVVSFLNYPVDNYGYQFSRETMKVYFPITLICLGAMFCWKVSSSLRTGAHSLICFFSLIQCSIALFLFHSNLGYTHATFQLPILSVFYLYLQRASKRALITVCCLSLVFSNFLVIPLHQLDEHSSLRVSIESFFNQTTQNPWSWQQFNFKEHRNHLHQQIDKIHFQEKEVAQGLISNLRPFQAFSMDYVYWRSFGFQAVHFNALNLTSSWEFVLKDFQENKYRDIIEEAITRGDFPIIYIPNERLSDWGNHNYWTSLVLDEKAQEVSYPQAVSEILKNYTVYGEMTAVTLLNHIAIEIVQSRNLLKKHFRLTGHNPLSPGAVWVHNSLSEYTAEEIKLLSFLRYYPNYQTDTPRRVKSSVLELAHRTKNSPLLARLLLKSLELLANERSQDFLWLFKTLQKALQNEKALQAVQILKRDRNFRLSVLAREENVKLLQNTLNDDTNVLKGLTQISYLITSIYKDYILKKLTQDSLRPLELNWAKQNQVLPTHFPDELAMNLIQGIFESESTMDVAIQRTRELILHPENCWRELSNTVSKAQTLSLTCQSDSLLQLFIEESQKNKSQWESAKFYCNTLPTHSRCTSSQQEALQIFKSNILDFKGVQQGPLELLLQPESLAFHSGYRQPPDRNIYSLAPALKFDNQLDWAGFRQGLAGELFHNAQNLRSEEPLRYLVLTINSNSFDPRNEELKEEVQNIQTTVCENWTADYFEILSQLKQSRPDLFQLNPVFYQAILRLKKPDRESVKLICKEMDGSE